MICSVGSLQSVSQEECRRQIILREAVTALYQYKECSNRFRIFTEKGWVGLSTHWLYYYTQDRPPLHVWSRAFTVVHGMSTLIYGISLKTASVQQYWLARTDKTRLLALLQRHERTSRMPSYTMQYKEENERQQQQQQLATVVLNTQPMYKTGRCPDGTLSI